MQEPKRLCFKRLMTGLRVLKTQTWVMNQGFSVRWVLGEGINRHIHSGVTTFVPRGAGEDESGRRVPSDPDMFRSLKLGNDKKICQTRRDLFTLIILSNQHFKDSIVCVLISFKCTLMSSTCDFNVYVHVIVKPIEMPCVWMVLYKYTRLVFSNPWDKVRMDCGHVNISHYLLGFMSFSL